jgi:hypothetical protein
MEKHADRVINNIKAVIINFRFWILDFRFKSLCLPRSPVNFTSPFYGMLAVFFPKKHISPTTVINTLLQFKYKTVSIKTTAIREA